MNETQLERIANALETIAAHLTGVSSVQIEETVTTEPVYINPVTETKNVSLDDIKNKLIEINRNDDTAKPKLKALLGKFSAVRASDLKEDDFLEIMYKLETGEY